jgi:DNA-3-methyladenine glycosylase I
MKNKQRCPWSGTDQLYIDYHDKEWGKQVKDDRILFEFLVLESAQAGLSWITILRKRENYRKSFAGFDPNKVAKFTEKDVETLLQNPGIIRNRGKIEAAINNAKLFLEIQKEYGSFYTYLYSFLPDQKPVINKIKETKDVPASTDISIKLSKELKKKGMKFFGPVTCYALMQAVGMVNDHELSCDFQNS